MYTHPHSISNAQAGRHHPADTEHKPEPYDGCSLICPTHGQLPYLQSSTSWGQVHPSHQHISMHNSSQPYPTATRQTHMPTPLVEHTMRLSRAPSHTLLILAIGAATDRSTTTHRINTTPTSTSIHLAVLPSATSSYIYCTTKAPRHFLWHSVKHLPVPSQSIDQRTHKPPPYVHIHLETLSSTA